MKGERIGNPAGEQPVRPYPSRSSRWGPERAARSAVEVFVLRINQEALKLREEENVAGVLQKTRDAIRETATPNALGAVPRNNRDAHLSGTWKSRVCIDEG